MKVFLTHGYFIAEDEKEQQIVRPYPPLGLLYVSAYLKKQGVQTIVFDSTFENSDNLRNNLLLEKPNVVAIYANLMTKINIIKLIKWIKKEDKLAHTKIVLGGPDLTYNVSKYLHAGADFLIIGEGEQTMHELVDYLQKGKQQFEEITGLAYLKHGKVVQTPPRIKLKDLSELEWPDRDAIDLNKYLNVWQHVHGKKTTNISTQRGCPYTCKWCSTAVYGQSYRRRPAKDVVQEILHLKEHFGVEALWFVDDVFTVSHKWLKELSEAFKEAHLSIPFECITRAERLTEEVLEQLKEMGCFRIWIGAESGSQKIVDAMDRKVDVVKVREMMLATKKKGMEAGTFVMVGYPGEKMEDIYHTYRHLRITTPNEVTVTKAYPIKGTQLYKEIEGKIFTNNNWETSTDREIDFKREYNAKVYDYAIKFIMNGYFAKSRRKKDLKYWKFEVKSQLARVIMHVNSIV